MEIDSFRSELEAEHTWRRDEIRLLTNQCAALPDEDQRDKFRRALILMLYAHYEGFCKFALNLYVSAINSLDIRCVDAHHALVVASLQDVFSSLRNSDKKSPEFRRELPDDKKLHRFALDIEFIERTGEIMQRIVKISDDVVDMESNLKPVVLRKNLFRLGLPYEQVAESEASLNKLLEFRNKIAHGETKSGVQSRAFEELSTVSFNLITLVTQAVSNAYSDRLFLNESARNG